jgi:hypothetical protein
MARSLVKYIPSWHFILLKLIVGGKKMNFSVGLWDRLFGEKATLEIPGENGMTIKRTVTKKWLYEMERQGKISKPLENVVRVHHLDPRDFRNNGYTTAHWAIGEDITTELYEKSKDPDTKELYAITTYFGDDSHTTYVKKEIFEEWLQKFRAIGLDSILKTETVKVHHIDPSRTNNYYTVEDWNIGEKIDQENVDKYKDPKTGYLYMVTMYIDEEPDIRIITRERFEIIFQEFKEHGLV